MEKNNQVLHIGLLTFLIALFCVIVYCVLNDYKVGGLYFIFWLCFAVDSFYEYKKSKGKYKLLMSIFSAASAVMAIIGYVNGIL